MRPVLPSVIKILVISLFLANCLFLGAACNKGKDTEGEDSTSTARVDKDSSDTGDSKAPDETIQGVPVEVTRAVTGEISSYILLSSTIETESRVDIYSQAPGLVDRILVEEGDHVSKGSVLARLDDKEYALDEAKAEVAFHKLENEFKRLEHMHHDELISVEEFENAGYERRRAELEWQKTKLLLEYTRIESPINGVVSERMINIGDRITTNAKVFSIVNLDSLIAVVYVPEREINRVGIGQDVKISSGFLEDEEISGWVKRISPVVDPNSGTFKVTIGLEGSAMKVRPGMFVNVYIVTGTHGDAILVPRDAIVYDGGREYIFLASEESTATKIEREKGFSNNQIVEVLSGVEHDDMVIVVGQSGIKDGAKVTILDQEDSKDTEEEELVVDSTEHSQNI